MKVDKPQLAAFMKKWSKKGKELQNCQQYWAEFLSVLGVLNPLSQMEPSKKVVVHGTTDWIDVYLPSVKVLIEQKSTGIDLDKSINNLMVLC